MPGLSLPPPPSGDSIPAGFLRDRVLQTSTYDRSVPVTVAMFEIASLYTFPPMAMLNLALLHSMSKSPRQSYSFAHEQCSGAVTL